MIPSIHLDTILSDPMLIAGAVLLIVGALGFLISLLMLVVMSARKRKPRFVMPADGELPSPPPPPVPISNFEKSLQQELKKAGLPKIVEPAPAPAPEPPKSERTMVIAPGEAELQAEIDIAIAQIKNLNKKVSELEERFELADKIELTEFKEMPNAAEFAQKFLKLAEHVIILEREVAKLRGEAPRKIVPAQPAAQPQPTQPQAQTQPRPPIMPV